MPANRAIILNIISKALDVLLVLIIFCFVCNVGRAVVVFSATGVITVSEVKEIYDIGYLKVDISRPVVSGFSDGAFERKLNLKIQNQITLNRKIAEMGTEQWFDSEHQISYAFHTDYCVKSSEGILSLKVTTEFWHYNCGGMPLSSYYNVDIANNKMLTLDKLFKDSSYQQRMKKYISDVMPDLYSDRFSISERTKFFIMDGNLHIAFSKYEICSGSEGEPEFLIPTEEIADLLKEEYKGIFR